MNKILALILLVNFSFASMPEFAHKKVFKLKKDEQAYVYIREKGNNDWEVFNFSWTLYDSLNLVVHTKFRKFPRQVMLSLRRGLELYKQNILPAKLKVNEDDIILYMEFFKFDKNIAYFNIMFKDKTNRIKVEFKPNQNE